MSRLRRSTILLVCALLLGAAIPSAASARRLGDRVLRVGSHGADVKTLQKLLVRSGFATDADGKFGPGTRTAVRKFQAAADLKRTGVVGPATVTILRAAAKSVSAAPAAPDGGITFGAKPKPSLPATPKAARPEPTDAAAVAAPTAPATLAADGLHAVAPVGAPAQIVSVIAAANKIATTPYRYGGGHGDFEDDAYDCSGSVSYALHGGGLLDTTLDSGSLMSWDDAGPGRWITIYANRDHVYMLVAGLRFDTSGQKASGSRWQTAARSNDGFTVRHPVGF